MDFSRPVWLWLWLAMPALMGCVARQRRRARRDWAALGVSHPLARLGAWPWLGAVALLLVAAAGPRWGRGLAGPSPTGRDVVLVIDVSRSMAAEDAVPNRLGLAVEAAEQIARAVGESPGGRVGVVAFAGRAVLRCPLTQNLGAALDVLAALRPGEVTPGGTDLAAALSATIDVLKPSNEEPPGSRLAVLISDGEDLAGVWRTALLELAESGVMIHTIAVGDADQGHTLPLNGPEGGTLTYRGRPVRSRREDQALESIAEASGGAFVRLGLSHPSGLRRLFSERIEPIALRRREQSRRDRDREDHASLFVIAALGLSLAGSWPSQRRMAWIVLGPLLIGIGAGPTQEERAAEAIARGNAAFASGDVPGALRAFEKAARLDPDSPVPVYNAASALFRLERYAEAAQHYDLARRGADDGLRTKIDFALGNTSFALGDVPAALRHYDDCLASRVPGRAYDAVRRDAAINREFAERYRPQAATEDEGRPSEPRSPSDAPPDPAPTDETDRRPSNPTPFSGHPRPEDTAASEAPTDETPQGQLEAALQRARDARRRRLTDPIPPASADPQRKDW